MMGGVKSRVKIASSGSVDKMSVTAVALVCVLAGFTLVHGDDSTYYIGMGRYDITGPSVQIEMVSFYHNISC